MEERFTTQKLVTNPEVPERKIDEQQDILRIFEVLKKYWDREREDKNQPFTYRLDQTEISIALDEARPYTFEDAQTAVSAFHTDWQKITDITQLSQEDLKEKELSDLVEFLQIAHKLIRRISHCWYSACRNYWHQKSLYEKQYRRPQAEFGIDIYDVDTFLAQSQEDRTQLLSEYSELNEIQKRFHVSKMQILKNRQELIEKAIRKLVSEKPKVRKELITKIDSSEQPIDDQMLDNLFGIEIEKVEQKTDYQKLREEYPEEEFWQDGLRWTPYELIRNMLRDLKLNDSDVMYDLGSGFGRVPIYASLATQAQCRGIEIVPERVAESIKVKNNLNIENLEFIQGNVLEQDYSEGNVFFLFNPFTNKTLEAVSEKLKQLAQTKKIKVISLGPSTSFFDHQSWLTPIETNNHLWGLTIYESQ